MTEKENLDHKAYKVFDNPIKEAVYTNHYVFPFIVFLPVSTFFLFKSFVINRVSVLNLIWVVPMVMKFWGYLEYFAHKNALHYNEETKIDTGIVKEFHELHHKYPNDPFRLATPLWVSVPGAFAFYAFCRSLFGKDKGELVYGFLVLYYLFYEFCHVAAHKYNIKHPFFEKIKKNHLKHHFTDSQKGYGFTTTEYDEKGGTDFPSRKERSKVNKSEISVA